ncbi:hypothetical protein [Aquimarina sp. MMG016]|uniref:hypothetical protein n=1 Tax=Aquimarina sp. MMG016 TaxID=2822690 RepID=UPI001B39F7E1|nr:hypothetical protein [Aquimarina sp. MMG016]MBQ4820717.1 hypothetical protein [Aquimarina sp. MMG016]
MKNTFILITTMLLVTGCNGQHHNEKGHNSHNSEQEKIKNLESETVESFPTVGFKAVYKDTIGYPIKDVFPLFEPQGRNLLYEN